MWWTAWAVHWPKGSARSLSWSPPDISNPFFAKVIAGVRESLGADYQLLLSVTDAGEFPQADDVRKLMALRARRA